MNPADTEMGNPTETNPEVVGFGNRPILIQQDGFLRPTPQRRYSWSVMMRCIIGTLLFSCISYVVFDFCGERMIESKLEKFLELTRTHTYEGMIAVILCYIVATVCFVPGSILTFGAGYAIGSSVKSTFFGVVLASTVSTYQVNIFPKMDGVRIASILHRHPQAPDNSIQIKSNPFDASLFTVRLYRSFVWFDMLIPVGQISLS